MKDVNITIAEIIKIRESELDRIRNTPEGIGKYLAEYQEQTIKVISDNGYGPVSKEELKLYTNMSEALRTEADKRPNYINDQSKVVKVFDDMTKTAIDYVDVIGNLRGMTLAEIGAAKAEALFFAKSFTGTYKQALGIYASRIVGILACNGYSVATEKTNVKYIQLHDEMMKCIKTTYTSAKFFERIDKITNAVVAYIAKGGLQ